ncbi:MAG: CPBP family intramembrane metalloprotease [Actinomycetia bacterium]|nr:CPBP family intramembrane metalloprotease [Actinomycetes bacterium]
MDDGWPFGWGVALPEMEPGLSPWPLVAVLVLLVMINVAANKALPGYYLFWALGGSVVVLMLGIMDGSTWRDLGMSPSTWLSGFMWGMATILLVFLIYAVGSTWKKTRSAFHDQNIAGLSKPRLFWQSMVELPIGTVLFEEIAFRAVLWSMLARRFGIINATIISSILFGLWHILPSLDLHLRHSAIGGVDAGGWWSRTVAIGGSVITTTIGGIVFCLLRIVSGSLLAPMGLHWATNGWGYLFARRVAAKNRKIAEE